MVMVASTADGEASVPIAIGISTLEFSPTGSGYNDVGSDRVPWPHD
jgi:hypothetical protein